MNIKIFSVNAFSENTYLVYDNSGSGLVIDPGFMDASETLLFDEFIKSNHISLKDCLQTHCHIDHIMGVHHINRQYGLKTQMHINEVPVFESGVQVSGMYGLPYTPGLFSKDFLEHGMKLNTGHLKYSVHFTPGHSPGSVCFYFEEQDVLISGDLIFKGSIGRTDLPGGDHSRLISSVMEEVFTLPEHTMIYPGHGDPTKVGEEKMNNPFFI